MSQPTPKADQLRALREAKHQRGTDANTNHGAVRKSSRDSIGGVSAVVRSHKPPAKTKVLPKTKTKAKTKAKTGKKQTVRKQGPANR